jgi:diguanylate cyclase (GGDEF)-like protein
MPSVHEKVRSLQDHDLVPQLLVGATEWGRRRSLRREWAQAFMIMLALLLVAAAATIVGVWGVVSQVQSTASLLHRESVTVASLRSDLVSHEETAHKLLSDEPADGAAFVAQQNAISVEFTKAQSVFASSKPMSATIAAADQSWQAGLTKYGLWGDQVQALHGDHSADNPTFGASSDATVALLDGLEGPSLDAMNQGLAHGADLEHLLIAVLAALFALALAVTVYFRRRMKTDLLRPVATMHEGVLKLRAGHYQHRLTIARHDELGELTQAFNGMADALHDSHQALTLRATHDTLTGLPNRASLTERLTKSFAPGSERRAWQESVLFIDVDDFKDVNDSLGHEGGDALLVQLAARLKDCVRPQDLVARLGGDEFAIVVAEDDDGSTATTIADRILTALHEPFAVNATPLVVSVSIGVAQRRPETSDAAELLRCADFAMYMAKGGGKDRAQIYDVQVHENMVDRSSLKTDLSLAVGADQLRLDYQPVADLRTGEVLGVEALVRWQHPTLGLLQPADFIALAEETGDITAIGCWVLDTATRQVAEWRATMPHCDALWVSVNLSPFQLPNPEGMVALQRILAEPHIQAEHVILEITETALTADIAGNSAALNTLKHFGVRIAIDDFGSGFSSLSALTSLPIDILKIDQTFISGQHSDAPSTPMLEAILGLADKLSLDVIAEGIEQPNQLDLLGSLGCRMGQGFLLSHPVAPDTLQALLASGGLLHLTHQAPAPRLG